MVPNFSGIINLITSNALAVVKAKLINIFPIWSSFWHENFKSLEPRNC